MGWVFMRPKRIDLHLALAFSWACVALAGESPPAKVPPPRVEFNRDVRPIIEENCFKCHGPDANQRKSGLRLDLREEAVKPAKSGSPAIVPGDVEESGLVKKIFAASTQRRMPPPASGKKLKDDEKEVLRRWIAEGAEYQPHWAFVPPVRPEPPAVQDGSWPRNPIDRFILARLEAEGMRPSQEADRVTLIRRLTLDLTGLPPSPPEVDAFLADRSPRAYEDVVERLLASPHHGERLALDWLDAARYADTHGYHIDSGRDMTRWREWVIESFNRNLPFDRFTTAQIAGDLLPGAGEEDRIASGFHRNHMINFEGGAIPEEYHNAYLVDRVNTTGTLWLGLTVACAQCHDHKYDPIPQKEYYQLYAFFNNVPENGLDGQKGNAAPFILAPTAEEKAELDRLAGRVREIEARLDGPLPPADEAQAGWEKTAAEDGRLEWSPLEPSEFWSAGGASLTRAPGGVLVAGGETPDRETYFISAPVALPGITALRLEALADPGLPAKGPGRSPNGNLVLTEVRAGLRRASGAEEPLGLKAASASFSQKDFPVAQAIDGRPETGWAIHPEVGKDHFAVFELARPAAPGPGDRLTAHLEFHSPFAGHEPGRFRLSVTSSPDPHGKDLLPEAILRILTAAPAARKADEKAELRRYFRSRVFPEGKALAAEAEKLRAARGELEKKARTAMVMQEMEKSRETHLLLRGQYDKPGEKVVPAVPAFLPPLPAGEPPNRLGLARWLVSPSNPLTARVAVNRYWQMFFGTGIVKTVEDFGSRGEPPVHPELLDWLATEFVRSGWDVKAMERLIVTSTAYRQSSAASPAGMEKDPEDRLLSRAPRFRLPAEFIRDQALAASGLLDLRIGGRSVSPYQPAGLWEELAYRDDGANWTAQVFVQSHGPDLYRRSMYTFWKRTSPPPSLITFDAPDRETCTVRRPRTNTPLQALVLMNDPTYVESSRKLAERLMREGGAAAEDRIALAYRLVLARRPSPEEVRVLGGLLADQIVDYRASPGEAERLLRVGETLPDPSLDPVELAAWAVVASTVLNLDEAITKG